MKAQGRRRSDDSDASPRPGRAPTRPGRSSPLPCGTGRTSYRGSEPTAILPRMADGHVIIIGGAEDKVRERVILNRFVTLAGGSDARISVISTASSLGPQAG